MYELTASDCQDVGGAFAPLAGLAFGLSVIAASGPLYEFFSGLFDGLGGI